MLKHLIDQKEQKIGNLNKKIKFFENLDDSSIPTSYVISKEGT